MDHLRADEASTPRRAQLSGSPSLVWRQPAKLMGSARTGSNPVPDAHSDFTGTTEGSLNADIIRPNEKEANSKDCYKKLKNNWKKPFGSYLRVKANLSEGNIHRSLSRINSCSKKINKHPKEIAVADVYRLKEKLILGNYSASYINNVLKTFRHWFRYRGTKVKFKYLPAAEPIPNFLTLEQSRALLKSALNPMDRAILSVLLYAGLRASELCKLKVKDIDLEQRLITVRKPKNRRDDIAVISDKSAAILSQWLRIHNGQTEHLFYTANGDLSYDALHYRFEKYSKRLGFKVHPHMLRHTLGTQLIANGLDVTFVQKQLRHKNIKSTMIYVHLNKDMLRKAYDEHVPKF